MPVFDPSSLAHQVAQIQQARDDSAASVGLPDRKGIGLTPYVAAELGQGADFATTLLALQNPNLAEGNPMGAKGALIGKAALMALVPYIMHKIEKDHPTAAKTMGYITGAAGAIPAASNIRMMNKYQ